jgi:hypothetical protein
MNEHSITSQPITPLPSDNLKRSLKARPDTDEGLPHIGLVGDTTKLLPAQYPVEQRFRSMIWRPELKNTPETRRAILGLKSV